MSVVVEFNVPGMTSEQYDQTISSLEARGLEAPEGRLYHVAAPTDEGWFVVDVWESAETFRSFGEVLVPILMESGVTPVEPVIREVHNLIAG